MSLVEAPPPSVPAEVRSWTLESLDDLAGVRAELEATLPAGADADEPNADGATPSLIQRIVLVASELATNALRHGRPPVTVRLLRDGDAATIDVVDRSPDSPPVFADDRAPGAGGFGLLLAHRAAQELGWFRAGDDEKHVWACFTVPA
jgi:serine/threonine-protein kinase RsbW